eukprot:4619315-Amphidinium_carterae.1
MRQRLTRNVRLRAVGGCHQCSVTENRSISVFFVSGAWSFIGACPSTQGREGSHMFKHLLGMMTPPVRHWRVGSLVLLQADWAPSW